MNLLKTIKRAVMLAIIAFLFILIAVFLFRFFSHREIDDVTPEIPCLEELFDESDVLWVVPLFENSIADNSSWCSYIKGLNKTLGLHGVEHRFNEFETDRSNEYLQRGIDAFESCFGFKPEMFKPPQLRISENNKVLIEKMGLELKGNFNQFMHKVYHCNDTGMFSNKFIGRF
ncbi:MAG: hypothetical protein AABX07_01125 [Nanoarchaeota archaeon]